MNILAVSAFTLATTCFLLAAFIAKNARTFLQKLWVCFNISVGIWGFGIFLASITSSEAQAFECWKFAHCGGFFVSVFFLHVTQKFCNLKRSWFLILTYIQACIFFVLNLFNEAGYTVAQTFNSIYYAKYQNFIYVLVTILFLLPVAYGHVELFRAYRHEQEVKRRNQMKFLFISMFIGFFGGSQHFLPVYGIKLNPAYGNFLIAVYALIATYAIFKYNLLDIEVIIRRTVVFAGLVAFVFGVFSAATFLVRDVLSQYIPLSSAWTYALSIFLIVLGYDPIRKLLVNITDTIFFQKRYDYQKLLKDATKGISKIESLHHLFGLVTHFITMKMRIKNAAVLSRQSNTGEFKLAYQRGYKWNYLEYFVDESNPLIKYFGREKEALDIEHVKEYIESGSKKKVKGDKQPHEYDFAGIKQQMEELHAVCCIPSFLGHELRNILVLGEKKSGDYYTEDDMNVLFTLAQESAIAIENARLFDEAIAKTHELERINRQLEFARARLTKALSEAENANKQLLDTQAQLIHEQKMATLGRLAASVGHEVNNPLTILSMNVSRAILKYRKNPDLKVAEVMDVFQKMEQNISRIKAVVNTLTGLLKKSEKGKFEPLSLKLILEETLPLVQFQTYLDNLTKTEVEFDVPGNIPLVRGDLERLQEVFLNLFINAYHAMAQMQAPRIFVHAELDPENPHMVAVYFQDNGSGMPEEVMKKVFNYGFTTKPPGKGSGLGLYMCKYIVELHGGSIRVDSQPGRGTTFILTLPVYEEATMADAGPQMKAG